jgi:hypothetical protein
MSEFTLPLENRVQFLELQVNTLTSEVGQIIDLLDRVIGQIDTPHPHPLDKSRSRT